MCIATIVILYLAVQVLVESECFMCGEELTCTVRDVLFQPDFGGHDYESGGLDVTFRLVKLPPRVNIGSCMQLRHNF